MAKSRSSELDADPQLGERSQINRAEKREDTRSKIALYYVIGFLAIVFVCFITSGIERLNINDTRDL